MPMVRDYAMLKGITVAPSIRRSHSRMIPVLGGVSIYVSLLLTLLIIFPYLFLSAESENSIQIYYFGFASSLLFTVGIIDDMYGLKPRFKFFFQLLCVHFF